MTAPIDALQSGGQSPEINPIEFPLGYFDAQVRFAQKWATISGDDFAETLTNRTALQRRVVGDAGVEQEAAATRWAALMTNTEITENPVDIARNLYEAYTQNLSSQYSDPLESHALGYDYVPDTKTVKIHFTNPKRGERPLSDENMDTRRAEFRAMLENVKKTHPEAALVMSATWLRSTSKYRSLSPPDIAPAKNIMSEDMKLAGNSVWGQLIDASGNTNKRVYDQFVDAVDRATTLDELIDAFPYKTVLAVDPIEKYYDFYDV